MSETTVKPIHNWQASAFNPATESSNRIHSDEMAKAYGYRGALVPGVVVSAYLMHPAVIRWGQDWLSHGKVKVVVKQPLYDHSDFEVQITHQTNSSYEAQLIDDAGTLCATASVELPGQSASARPRLRGDALLERNENIPDATPETLHQLKASGMKAYRARWDNAHSMASYLRDPSHMPDVHRLAPGGYAHGAFMLGITNWILAGNAYMNPWVHLQTSSQFFAPAPYGAALIAESEVKELFSKKGHEFVEIGVNVFLADTEIPVMSADLRAIYRMRPA